MNKFVLHDSNAVAEEKLQILVLGACKNDATGTKETCELRYARIQVLPVVPFNSNTQG